MNQKLLFKPRLTKHGRRPVRCCLLLLAACLLAVNCLTLVACDNATTVYTDRYVPQDPYAAARQLAVSDLTATTTSQGQARLSWSALHSQDIIGYNLSVGYQQNLPAAAPFLPARVTLPELGPHTAWYATNNTTVLLPLLQSGTWIFQVFPTLTDNSLGAGSNVVTLTVLPERLTTGTTVTNNVSDPPITAAIEPCYSARQLLTALSSHTCFDLLNFDHPGTDAIWGNNDDVPAARSLYAISASTDLTLFPGSFAGWARLSFLFSGAGADGLWQTEDDILASVYDARHALASAAIRLKSYALANTWCIRQTTDLSSYETITATTPTTATGVVYNHTGFDQHWLSADDGIRRWHTYTLNTGMVEQFIANLLPGNDFLWFTPDDWIGAHERFYYDAAQALTAVVIYGDPGSDVTFGNNDDLATRLVFYARTSAGGPIINIDVYDYDALSAVTVPTARIYYSYGDLGLNNIFTMGPGTDATLGSSDDVTLSVNAIQTTNCGALP